MKIELRPQSGARCKKTRVFIWPDETILDNMRNRKARPFKQWRKDVLPKVFSELGLAEGTRARWSQYAGCSCGCSPAFILDINLMNRDIHVSLGEEEDTYRAEDSESKLSID